MCRPKPYAAGHSNSKSGDAKTKERGDPHLFPQIRLHREEADEVFDSEMCSPKEQKLKCQRDSDEESRFAPVKLLWAERGYGYSCLSVPVFCVNYLNR